MVKYPAEQSVCTMVCFGGFGEVVERTEDFAPAFERAIGAGKIALLELRIDPDMISTRTTLKALRELSNKNK